MPEQSLLVLVDTNIWISAFINPTGYPAKILAAFTNQQFRLAISQPIIDEIVDVLSRDRIRMRLRVSEDRIHLFLDQAQHHAVEASPKGQVRLCRNPRDDVLLETAILARAQFFVARDDDVKRDLDLISHLEAHGVEVVSVAHFLERLTSNAQD